MSVYKRKGETQYSYDFWVGGRRFTGGTGQASRREAEKVEREAKDRAKAEVAAEKSAAGAPLTFAAACMRYWEEVGRHHANRETTMEDILRVSRFLGDKKRLDEISDDDVAMAVTWRRGMTARGKASTVSAATVNRSVIDVMQKVLTRARKVWRIPLPREPIWSQHRLKEPRERVREVRGGEAAAIEEALRDDYLPVMRFALASGLRLSECLLRKDQVDLIGGYVHTTGKGGRPIDKPISSEMRAILMGAMANPTDVVFTYEVKRTRDGRKRGERLPITASGLKTQWRRARARGLPADLRFHDLRHDFATRLLRATGNLKTVQRALGHADISTTTRYAHVDDADVLEAMERVAKSREKSRGCSPDARNIRKIKE